MTSKFNKAPLIISLILVVIVSYTGIWVADGELMPVFGGRGSIFWLFWLNSLNPISKVAGSSSILWVISTAFFWVTVGFVGGKLCKRNIHVPLFFLGVFIVTFLITLFVFRVMIGGEAGSQIWVPMWPRN